MHLLTYTFNWTILERTLLFIYHQKFTPEMIILLLSTLGYQNFNQNDLKFNFKHFEQNKSDFKNINGFLLFRQTKLGLNVEI